MKVCYDYDLSRHNTFGVASRCRRYVETATTAETQDFVRSEHAAVGTPDRQLIIVGGGSNILFPPTTDATVVHPAVPGMTAQAAGDDVRVTCGAGELWDDVVAWCVERGFHGAENLSGIPGSVGATAVQNIGAYGAEAKDLICGIEAVDVATGDIRLIAPGECRYGYRHSRFKDDWCGRYIITHVSYCLSRTFRPQLGYGNLREMLTDGQPTATAVRQAVLDIRAAKLPDPAVEGNAGSFFMNPVVSADKYNSLSAAYPSTPCYRVEGGVKVPAAWLIEQCGWKGRTLGRAGVHSRQALVIVNKGGATADDILRLMHAIQADVEQRFGIRLQPEVVMV